MKNPKFYDLVEELKGKSSIVVKNMLSHRDLNVNGFLIFLSDEIKDLENFVHSSGLKSGEIEVGRLKDLRKAVEEYFEDLRADIRKQKTFGLTEIEFQRVEALGETLLGVRIERVLEILAMQPFDRVIAMKSYLIDQVSGLLPAVSVDPKKLQVNDLIDYIDSFISSGPLSQQHTNINFERITFKKETNYLAKIFFELLDRGVISTSKANLAKIVSQVFLDRNGNEIKEDAMVNYWKGKDGKGLSKKALELPNPDPD